MDNLCILRFIEQLTEFHAAVEIESKVNSDRSGKMTLNINDYDFTKMQNILIELYWDDISNQIKMKQYKI